MEKKVIKKDYITGTKLEYNKWIKLTNKVEEEIARLMDKEIYSEQMMGYSRWWVDGEIFPTGIRPCFLQIYKGSSKYWICAEWNLGSDTWEQVVSIPEKIFIVKPVK